MSGSRSSTEALPRQICERSNPWVWWKTSTNSAAWLVSATPGRPMSDGELDTKVRELIAAGAPKIDASGLIAAIRAILGEADAARIVRLTVAA